MSLNCLKKTQFFRPDKIIPIWLLNLTWHLWVRLGWFLEVLWVWLSLRFLGLKNASNGPNLCNHVWGWNWIGPMSARPILPESCSNLCPLNGLGVRPNLSTSLSFFTVSIYTQNPQQYIYPTISPLGNYKLILTKTSMLYEFCILLDWKSLTTQPHDHWTNKSLVNQLCTIK